MKVPFEILDEQISKMYDEISDIKNSDLLDIHLGKIVKFISNCGWTEDEYFRHVLEIEKFN